MIGLLFILIGLGLPLILGFGLGKSRKDWRKRKVLLSASLPIPTLISLPSVFLVVVTLVTPRDKCGVDACGMSLAVGMMGLIAAVVLAGIGLLTAWLGFALARRSSKTITADTFE